MTDDLLKRHLAENERLARMMRETDPWQKIKAADDATLRAHERLSQSVPMPGEGLRSQMELLARPLEQSLAHLPGFKLGKLAEQIESLTQPVAGMLQQVQAALPNTRIAEIIQSGLKPFDRAKIAEKLQALEPLNQAQAWLKVLHEQELERQRRWGVILGDIAEQMREWPREIRAQLDTLFAKGWCLDPEMPVVSGRQLVEAFRRGEEQEAQLWLVRYFTRRLDSIESNLVERHPTRAGVIADAFAAHREGRYSLSIPALLAQADGVIHDRHERQLYSKNSGANLKKLLDELPDDDMRAIALAAFYMDIPLTRKTDHLPPDFDGLNRHAVLHGTDPSYGTEINSLRAVSILNLASYLATEDAEEAEETEADVDATAAADAPAS